MFYGCSSLKKLNLSNFNTNNAIEMESIFTKCSSLQEINLPSLNNNKLIGILIMNRSEKHIK